MSTTGKLFSGYNLGGLELDNSIVIAPMTRSRAIGNTPNELMAEYYGQRNSAGLIITEGTSPAPNGLGYPRIPAAYSTEQTEGWKLVTKAIHKGAGKVFLQIMHTGRVAHPANFPDGEGRLLAPSAITAAGQMYVDNVGMKDHPQPEEMSKADIQETINWFVTSAKNAIAAGFDGVEVHAANGYLPNQFLNTKSNQRTDEYGGSPENRARFVIELTKAVADTIGKEKTGIRVSPYGLFNDLEEYDTLDETYLYLTEQLSDLGIVYLHVNNFSSGNDNVFNLWAKMREAFNGAFIVCGGFSKESGEQWLQEGKADLVAYGHDFIANPDLVERFKNNWPLAESDQSTYYMPGPDGYTDYPTYKAESVEA